MEVAPIPSVHGLNGKYLIVNNGGCPRKHGFTKRLLTSNNVRIDDQIANTSIRCLDHEARRGCLLPEDSRSTRLSVSTKVARVAITVWVLNS